MRFNTLDDWLNWQQTLHPKAMELGLERVRLVFQNLELGKLAKRVISVAGTNGKGSTVACYETWLNNSGYQVGSFTSPHILRYNERIKLDRQAVSDQRLCQAFDTIDLARGDIPLTYFEFGTLAAFVIIAEEQPDYAILEVGLGGRLDAVNIVDADLAHITTIGLDHQQWLGDTRDQIGFEKAGILRQQGLAVVNDTQPPASVMSRLRELECQALVYNQDYRFHQRRNGQFSWQSGGLELAIQSPLRGMHQVHNMSGVLAGLQLLGCLQNLSEEAIAGRFKDLVCAGRLQLADCSLPVPLLLDVGHNQDAASVLAEYLRNNRPAGRIVVLLGMLEDKEPALFAEPFGDAVDEWWLLDLNCPRGLAAQQLRQRMKITDRECHLFNSAEEALTHALSSLDNQDILLVTGSFMTVEAVLKTSYFKR